MENMLSGGCQCGAMRYTISGPLPPAYACHCSECKRQSGSSFGLSIAIEWARFAVEGEVAVSSGFAFSGKPKLRCFCPKCGNRLWHRPSADSAWITLKAGTLDCAQDIEPRGHLWVSQKQPWIRLEPDIPTFDTQPEDVHTWRTNLI
jgi:hypothetical protein